MEHSFFQVPFCSSDEFTSNIRSTFGSINFRCSIQSKRKHILPIIAFFFLIWNQKLDSIQAIDSRCSCIVMLAFENSTIHDSGGDKLFQSLLSMHGTNSGYFSIRMECVLLALSRIGTLMAKYSSNFGVIFQFISNGLLGIQENPSETWLGRVFFFQTHRKNNLIQNAFIKYRGQHHFHVTANLLYRNFLLPVYTDDFCARWLCLKWFFNVYGNDILVLANLLCWECLILL